MRSATTYVRKPPGELDGLRAALERRGQPALAVRERDDDVLVGAAALDDLTVVGQRVLAERDAELRDRDWDRRDAGDGLGDVRVRREVDAPVQPERLAARGDRVRVVLARQAVGHAAILA